MGRCLEEVAGYQHLLLVGDSRKEKGRGLQEEQVAQKAPPAKKQHQLLQQLLLAAAGQKKPALSDFFRRSLLFS